MPATEGGVTGGGPRPLVRSARTSCRGRFDDDRRKNEMNDDTLFRNKARKRVDCSRREFIMFEWGRGVVLIWLNVMKTKEYLGYLHS